MGIQIDVLIFYCEQALEYFSHIRFHMLGCKQIVTHYIYSLVCLKHTLVGAEANICLWGAWRGQNTHTYLVIENIFNTFLKQAELIKKFCKFKFFTFYVNIYYKNLIILF